jgi:hypothetical protein
MLRDGGFFLSLQFLGVLLAKFLGRCRWSTGQFTRGFVDRNVLHLCCLLPRHPLIASPSAEFSCWDSE